MKKRHRQTAKLKSVPGCIVIPRNGRSKALPAGRQRRVKVSAFEPKNQSQRRSGGGVRKRRMEITVETTRLFIASGESSQVRAWCEKCGAQARMITVDQAATVAGMNRAAACGPSDAMKIHFVETCEGSVLVCLNSLLELI